MTNETSKPRLLGVEPGPKIETDQDEHSITPVDIHLMADISRYILSHEGVSVEEARKEIELSYGKALLKPLDNTMFPGPKVDKAPTNEVLSGMLFSKAINLRQPVKFIGVIFEIHRLMGNTPNQEKKIRLSKDFGDFVQITASIYNRGLSLDGKRIKNMQPVEIQRFRSETMIQIRQNEEKRRKIYRRMFGIDQLIKSGYIADEGQADHLLTTEAQTLLSIFKSPGDTNKLNNEIKNHYLREIVQYMAGLEQED